MPCVEWGLDLKNWGRWGWPLGRKGLLWCNTDHVQFTLQSPRILHLCSSDLSFAKGIKLPWTSLDYSLFWSLKSGKVARQRRIWTLNNNQTSPTPPQKTTNYTQPLGLNAREIKCICTKMINFIWGAQHGDAWLIAFTTSRFYMMYGSNCIQSLLPGLTQSQSQCIPVLYDCEFLVFSGC